MTILASPSLLAPSPPLVASPIIAAAAAVPLPHKVAALNADAAKVISSLKEHPGSSTAHGSGLELEALLTGAALSAPSTSDDPAASPEELAFVAAASPALAARTDDLAAAKGLKAARMSGAEFLAILDEARGSAPSAPTPAAASAAKEIESQLVRVARALIPADQPLSVSIRRALSVWQVFDQEMAIAASKGALSAVVDDAKLFASQVEDSVAPKKADPAPLAPSEPLKANEHPEDPEGYAKVGVPGSIFGWKPIEESPGHGLPPLDALIRRVLSDKQSVYAKGFELAGAAKREDARIHFYGERHTDGALISANMRRLVEDARPGKPVIVLVESYTGWSLRGWEALKYLADRGLNPDALAAKDIPSGAVEVRGWDTAANYDASKHPLLQHHMDLLALNHLAHGETRGWRYYREFARAALTAWRGFQELWTLAIVARNKDLDRAVAQAADDAVASGATVHVIAGTDHLMQNPRLVGWPLIGRPSMRKSLAAALASRPYWASQPPNTKD